MFRRGWIWPSIVVLPLLLFLHGCGGGSHIERTFPPLPQQSVPSLIPAAGGSVTLPLFATATFPAGAFPGGRNVTVEYTNRPDTNAIYAETAAVFRPQKRSAYELRINTGNTPPVVEGTTVTFQVTDDLLGFKNAAPEVMVQSVERVGLESLDNFQIINSTANPGLKTLTAVVPNWAFTNTRRADRMYESVLLLATTPGTNGLTPSDDAAVLSLEGEPTCDANTLGPPLAREIKVVSPYGERIDPATGQKAMHWGVDLEANGDDVLAASDGTVEFVGNGTGYGYYLVLRHVDQSATLYGHLQQGSAVVGVGTVVKRGDKLAVSGSSGTAVSPHLHFEYIPNGRIFFDKRRINPFPCIGASTEKSSISVGDNGPAADDAFEVVLDDIKIGETFIGETNTISISNLRPGKHNLKVTAIIAPDDAGTYGITLSDGLTFGNGGTDFVEGTLIEKGFVEYTIIVPPRPAASTGFLMPPPPIPRNLTPEKDRPKTGTIR
jgi:hypothetical protein